MPALKSTTWSRAQLVPVLIVLTICYQVIYHVFLFGALEKDAGREECVAPSVVGGAESPHCIEVRLFRSWQKKEMINEEMSNAKEQDDAELSWPAGESTAVVVDEVGATMAPLAAPPVVHGLGNASVIDSMERRAERIQQRHALFDQLEQSIRASLNTSSSMTPWAKDLQDLQSHLESELTSLEVVRERKEKFRQLEQSVRASLKSTSITPWARNLMALQKHLEDDMRASENAHRTAAEARHARHVALRANVSKEFSQKLTTLENHLAGMASDRKEWEANLVTKYGVPADTTTMARKSFLEKKLQWATVEDWSKVSWRPQVSLPRFTSEKMSVVSRREVRHMKWSGAIPNVACITGIEGSRHTKARIMYFVNNFRLQDYEGPHQLVFVYHHSDTAAAELVRSYVDGYYIKSVVTFGDKVFPSAAALRYGAWSAFEDGADVIARWDFEEWHDPSRLSTQVRAMAMTSRPACVTRLPQDSGKDDQDQQQGFSASSLIGERNWMNQHWHPLEESEVLEKRAAQVVQLDMQNDRLISNMSHIHQTLDEQETKSPTNKMGHAYDMSECLEFEYANTNSDDGRSLEATIDTSVGPDMSQQFHKLMKRRHDITQKLQLLCLQSVLEKDAHKQVFMRQHVDSMAGIRAELDKHITSMTTLFAAP